MATKLWQKKYETDKRIEAFTVGNDTYFDLSLAPFDVMGSLAHIQMLETIGLIEKSELPLLQDGLKDIYQTILAGEFIIEEGIEDIHSQIEVLLTRKLGDVGKKIHSGRSRNDQVLVDLKLFMRSKITDVVQSTTALFELLIKKSEEHKHTLLPGYTHLQIAMPSSFGLWFGAYAESLIDDLNILQGAYKVVNKNPLGSAAGYGSSFPLNRTLTTQLLGFESLHYNVVYAQMSRGKSEKLVATGIASIASTLSRMAMDVCLYMSQNFNFITFPDELTTGSSIMPHKKNPDVFEIMRGKCNKLAALPNEITMMCTNLPSGYHREMQLLKEGLFPAFDTIIECLEMAAFMFEHVQVRSEIVNDSMYDYIFSVETVNNLALEGMPFRDAYKKVGEMIADGTYSPSREVHHSHEGSIGNLCHEQVRSMMHQTVAGFEFEHAKTSIERLLKR